jgi:aminopeptidase C
MESRKAVWFCDYVMWFPKSNKSHLGKFTRKWFRSYILQYVLPNNIMLSVTIEKFETNPMLINKWNLKSINKNNKC